jgi:hypothetical protein
LQSLSCCFRKFGVLFGAFLFDEEGGLVQATDLDEGVEGRFPGRGLSAGAYFVGAMDFVDVNYWSSYYESQTGRCLPLSSEMFKA